jgi:hypothetical protein
MAGKLDIEIEQGTTWLREVIWQDGSKTPIDVTDYHAALQVRESKDSNSTLLSLLDTGTSPAIVVGTTDGKFTITLPAATSAALSFETAVYDFKVTSDTGVVTRLLEGNMILNKAVTR